MTDQTLYDTEPVPARKAPTTSPTMQAIVLLARVSSRTRRLELSRQFESHVAAGRVYEGIWELKLAVDAQRRVK